MIQAIRRTKRRSSCGESRSFEIVYMCVQFLPEANITSVTIIQIFTAAPPLAMGLFDRYCSAETMMKNPVLYKDSQTGRLFSFRVRRNVSNAAYLMHVKKEVV